MLLKFLIFISGLTLVATDQCPTASLEEAKNSESSLTQFAFNLYKKVITHEKFADKNAVMSPSSIALALAMLEIGADGNTRSEIKQALIGIGPNTDVLASYRSLQQQLKIDDGNTKLSMANGLFMHKGFSFKSKFISTIRDCFQSVAETKDFQSLDQTRREINRWVSDQTNQKIPELFEEGVLDSDTVLVLANAIYFKAQWKAAFNAESTSTQIFFKFGRDEQNVPFMSKSAPFGYLQTDELQVIELKYNHESLSMFLIVPEARDGLRNLETTFTAEKFKEIVGQLRAQQLLLRMPKFNVRSAVNLKEILSSMGLRDMFDEGMANFDRISSKKPMWLSSAVHEAFINVNENGTEAAAATGFGVSWRSMGEEVVVDRPFIYAIVHKLTGAIIFMGKVNYIEENLN